MELEWIDGNVKTKALYWSECLNVESIKKYALEYDVLQVWYPKNIQDDIFEEYGVGMSFIEFNGKWKGEAHSSVIDLELSQDDILKGYSKNRRYETKRAGDRDNLEIVFYVPEKEEDLQEYIEYYNMFAKSKNRDTLYYNRVSA